MALIQPVRGDADPRNANRRMRANIPKMFLAQDEKKFPPVFIFNVFQREHQRYCGGRGLKTIPACPEGEAYSAPLVCRGLEIEEYDLADGGGNMSFTADDGMDVARDIIGTESSSKDFGLYTSNLEWFGVFATTSNPPTQEELREARKKLTRMMKAIFDSGRKLAASGPKGLESIGENHNLAARFLNIAPPWSTITQEMVNCPDCAEAIQPLAKKCRYCGFVLAESESDSGEAKPRGRKNQTGNA